MRLSDTSVSGVDYLQDHGSSYALGTGNHSLTLYRHASGALVFGTGTVQWSWGLDDHHDRGNAPPSLAMQQATINLFADMGTQPVTLQPGLVLAAPSSDSVAATSTVTSPAANSDAPANAAVIITGTASDSGGHVGRSGIFRPTAVPDGTEQTAARPGVTFGKPEILVRS